MVADIKMNKRGLMEEMISFLISVVLLFLYLFFIVQAANAIRVKATSVYMTTYKYGDLELKSNPPLYIIHPKEAKKTTAEIIALAAAKKGEYEWYSRYVKKTVPVKEILETLYDETLKENYRGQIIYEDDLILEFGPGGEFGAKTPILLPSVFNSRSLWFEFIIVT